MRLDGRRVLVDTNVWVDNYCGSHARGADAQQFIYRAHRDGAVLMFAVHCAKDVAYVLEAEFKRMARQGGEGLDEWSARAAHQSALACMQNMCEVATAVGADVTDVWLANKYLRIHDDFEDNLVLSACRRAKADFLVTNDRSLISHANVVAKTPAEMLALMDLED